jgi:glutathione peroxidase
MNRSFPLVIKNLVYSFLKRIVKKSIHSAPKNTISMTSIYDIPLVTINGAITDLKAYKGVKMLLVNTASACGYTAQYAALQKLYETKSDKIAVLGFPCNDFGAQEQGSESEIATFCEVNFGVTFPMFSKLHVKGDQQHSLYKWLSDPAQNGWNSELPSWNFCKYLIDEEGNLEKMFSSSVDPLGEQILA